jgi:hypothetical protein
MSRQLDLEAEERTRRQQDFLIRAIEFDLVGSLAHQGVTLLGFSASLDDENVLIVLRAEIGGVRRVAFVYSDTLSNAITKCTRWAKQDRLRWRQDAFASSDV